MKKRLVIPTLSKTAERFFTIASTLMVFVFLYLLVTLVKTPENEKAWLWANAYTMLEYAIMSFTIVFCGTFQLDVGAKGL